MNGGWLAGTNFGEWGGDLWWLPDRAAPSRITAANVHGFVEHGGRLLMVQGIAHLGVSTGSLLEIRQRRSEKPTAEVFATLPGRPGGLWQVDGDLILSTRRGLVAIDGEGTLRPLACARPPSSLAWAQGETPQAQDGTALAASLASVRPQVDRCFAAKAPASRAEDDAPRKDRVRGAVLLILDGDGSVIEARPSDWNEAPAHVATCIADAASGWVIRGFDGPAAFVHLFDPPQGR